MAVQDKYQSLIETAKSAGVTNLNVKVQNNVLYIDGQAPTAQVKDQLWNLYNTIDPDFRAGDLVLDVKVAAMAAGTKAKVTTDSSNLNIRKGPGTDQPIVGKAAHNATITILSQSDTEWSLVRTENGEEGYAYSRYLAKA
jgi:uncharacterized protein YgiM (DUF1202 family)